MTRPAQAVSAEASGAFVERSTVEPTASGPLDGLSFAVKDLIDVAGRPTGFGNPRWRETHPPAVSHAVCVEQLLAAGARYAGKTVTDEFAFSLLGENHFYGTPLNPRAPDRVPGGSSSGSASAVACGLVDVALGTDTGGSVRVPASNCGLWGLRPSHGRIAVAGVLPFAPSFDTVGVLARDADVLASVAEVLLGTDVPVHPPVGAVHLVREAFALCDPEVVRALEAPLALLRRLFDGRVTETSVCAIDGESEATGLAAWYEGAFRPLQWAEIWSSLGAWLRSTRPDLGPVTAHNLERSGGMDRGGLNDVLRRRERYARGLAAFLGPGDLLCIPTVPAPPPVKGTVGRRDQDSTNYYPRALPLTSLAGVGRLPQISLPLARCDGGPVGLSLLAGFGQDAFLLGVARMVADQGPA
jgi:amidase